MKAVRERNEVERLARSRLGDSKQLSGPELLLAGGVSTAEERATAAFVLGLIGAIFHLIGGLAFIFIGTLFAGFGLGGLIPPDAPPGSQGLLAGIGFALIAVAVIFIILAFLGAFWMYSGDKRRTTYGGILTLIIAIIAFPTLWGLFIGSLLGFIGAILGLVWSPTPAMPAPAPAAAAPPVAPAPMQQTAPAPEPEESSDE